MITLKEFFDSRQLLLIHVRNEEEMRTLLNAFDAMGKKWNVGASYLTTTRYEHYKEQTVYSNNGLFGSVDGAGGLGKVFEFDEVVLPSNKLDEYIKENQLEWVNAL